MTEAEIRNVFRYHAPSPESIAAHEMVRTVMVDAVTTIAADIPLSRERSLFITLCQEAQMMANAAIAIHGIPEAKQE